MQHTTVLTMAWGEGVEEKRGDKEQGIMAWGRGLKRREGARRHGMAQKGRNVFTIPVQYTHYTVSTILNTFLFGCGLIILIFQQFQLLFE